MAGDAGFLKWWDQDFPDRCEQNHNNAALGAMRRLYRAGMRDQAKLLLWYYADPLGSYRKSISHEKNGIAKIASASEQTDYAIELNKERRSDPRAEWFERKMAEKVAFLGCHEWPFRNPKVHTFAQAAVSYPEIESLSTEEAPETMRRGAEAVRRYGTKIFLAVLQECARALRFRLGIPAILALAHCADPTKPLDKRNLEKFLSRPDVHKAAREILTALFELPSDKPPQF